MLRFENKHAIDEICNKFSKMHHNIVYVQKLGNCFRTNQSTCTRISMFISPAVVKIYFSRNPLL